MSITRAQVIEFLTKMSAVELAKLAKDWEETVGVCAASSYINVTPEFLAMRASYGAPPPPAMLGLYLIDIGDNATPLYVKLREELPLSLQEVKTIRERLPLLMKQDSSRGELESLARELRALGASIEIKPL